MIIFKKFGETVVIHKDDWNKLRKRFNPERAKWVVSVDLYKIRGNCSLCATYLNNDCDGCPFSVFKEGKFGCFIFFEQVFKSAPEFDSGDRTEVTWNKDEDKKARKQLNRLQRMMDKIEASQGEKDVTK